MDGRPAMCLPGRQSIDTTAPSPAGRVLSEVVITLPRLVRSPLASPWPSTKMAETSFTIFADANSPGWAEGFAALLRDGTAVEVDIADSLDSAIDGDSDVLILNLGRRDDEKLSPERIATLARRRVVGMAPGVDWLCDQLDELEVHGGMIAQANLPMLLVDSDLLGERSTNEPIKPFAKPQQRTENPTARTPVVYFGTGDIDEYRPSVDYILVAEHSQKCAVVMRQANFVYAGVWAHPGEWSGEYRALVRRVALTLAERPIVDLVPLVVERQIHPPGAVRFDLEPITHGTDGFFRLFHFRFDHPTVFTATLEHTGSNAMMLLFAGGKRRLHGQRVDTEDGRTLTITANISAASNRAVRHRYWMLNVTNFDHDHGASAKLTVQYDTLDSEVPILGLPGNAGFEHLNRHADQLFQSARDGNAPAHERLARHDVETRSISREMARSVTAREYGLNDWKTLKAHVAWTPVWLPRDGTRGVDIYFARASERYAESFSFEQFVEFTENFNDDVIESLKEAFSNARSRGHQSLSPEHLLMALLDNPVADHVLRSAGCKVDSLRPKIDALLAASPLEPLAGDVQVSKSAYGAVYRANFVNTLGRGGTSAGNLLAGIMGERGDAAKLMNEQGVAERDLVNYVTHGIATELVAYPQSQASVLAPDLERAVHEAFVSARTLRHEYLTIEHLLQDVLRSDRASDALRSLDVDARGLELDLATFVETATPLDAELGGPEPTRTFNRVMQVTVARARFCERFQANAVDALWALCGERDVPVADFLERYGVRRSDIATRMS